MAKAKDPAALLIDSVVVALATAHGADLDADLEWAPEQGDPEAAEQYQQQRLWQAVAVGVQGVLRGFTAARRDLAPAGPGKARGLGPDGADFTAAVCQQRARFAAWRAGKEKRDAIAADKTERLRLRRLAPGVSAFNVTRGDSLQHAMDRILADARTQLPHSGALGVGSDSGSDSDDGAVEVYQPPAYCVLSEEDQHQHQQRCEAEDALVRRVQQLQQDFYAEHKRWVDVPALPHVDAEHKAKEVGAEAETKAGADVPTPPRAPQHLRDYTVGCVLGLLEDLGLSAHAPAFRRTTGRLLAALPKADVRARFGSDAEAADVFWARLMELRGDASPVLTEPSPVRDASGARALFDSLKRPGPREETEAVSNALRSGDLSSLKHALGSGARPLRPSEQRHMDPEEDEGPAPAPARVVKDTAPPSGRAARWQIMEYDDDDDDE